MTEDQPTENSRKSPIQARARKTVDTILEATAQILSEDGGERLTTNQLARKAGFSIGTIYQYFPNREAIVLALIERQRDAVAQRIQSVLADGKDDTLEQQIRKIARVLHEAFNTHRNPRPGLALALLRMAVTRGLPTPPNTAVRAIISLWQDAGKAEERLLNESEVFVLTRAVIETLRQATLQGSPLLGTPEFEEAILRLVFGFLPGSRSDLSSP